MRDEDRLQDVCNDRQIAYVKAPVIVKLDKMRVFPAGEYTLNRDLNIELVKNYLMEQGLVSKDCLLEILRRARMILNTEPNLVRVDGRVTIVGDIHGQFFDMMKMISDAARFQGKFLFLGDYVDRGIYGPAVAIYLLCLKIINPRDVILLRGNHETRAMTESFGFREQMVMAYDEEVYDDIMDTFDLLPISANVNG